MSDTLYRNYREDRNNGMAHEAIAEIYGSESAQYRLKYDLEIAAYVDAMNRMAERDSIGDTDTYGRPLRTGT